MALSEHEQRLLEEMERRFYQSEADVVETSSAVRQRPNYRAVVLGVVVFLIGVAVLLGGVAARQMLLGVVGFCVMVGGVALMFMRGSAAAGAGAASGRPAGSAGDAAKGGHPAGRKRGSGFVRRMEDRWDRRMDGDL